MGRGQMGYRFRWRNRLRRKAQRVLLSPLSRAVLNMGKQLVYKLGINEKGIDLGGNIHNAQKTSWKIVLKVKYTITY